VTAEDDTLLAFHAGLPLGKDIYRPSFGKQEIKSPPIKYIFQQPQHRCEKKQRHTDNHRHIGSQARSQNIATDPADTEHSLEGDTAHKGAGMQREVLCFDMIAPTLKLSCHVKHGSSDTGRSCRSIFISFADTTDLLRDPLCVLKHTSFVS